MTYIDGKEILFSPNINIGEGGGGVMEYNETIIFKKGDIVSYNGLLYTPKADNTSGILPTNEIAWEELASGKANKFEVASLRDYIETTVQTFDEYSFFVDTRCYNLEQADIITNKRLANLESATLDFIEDSTVAYQKIVPENALPYAQINKIGGMTYKDGAILRSAPVTELISEGVNIWDEQWKKASWTSAITSSNLIPVLPNTKYFMTHQPANGLIFYDKNKAQIKTIYDAIFTTPDNCHFISFTLGNSYGVVYLNDICINKYDTAINGKYYPYFKRAFTIPEAVRPTHGINENVYDYIEWCEDGTRKKHKRVGVVDLGTLDWIYKKDPNYPNRFGADLNDMKKNTENCIIADYKFMGYGGYGDHLEEDKSFGTNNITINIHNSAYTDAAAFKSAMSGVMLYYELATPEVIDISNLITDDNYIEVEVGGTITAVNEYNFAVPTTIDYITDIGE